MSDQVVLSLPGVAALANVQRPVVSMWRSRSADSAMPFPAPVMRREEVELFDAHEVVAWLEATGRGNNRNARADVMLHAQLVDAETEGLGQVQQAMLCLLRLAAEVAVDATADDLHDLADEIDPDDEFLYSEVIQAGERAPSIARFVRRLVDAAYGYPEALENLQRRHDKASQSPARLTAEAAEVLANVLAAVALDAGASALTVEDVGGRASQITSAGLSDLRERLEVDLVVSGGGAVARSARRRCIIADGLPAAVATSQCIAVVNLLSTDGTVNVAAVLDAIDNLQLEQTDADRVIILGSAAALCDELPGVLEKQRAEVLRLGRVRFIAKLPAGCLVHHPRERLGLWVLGPEAESQAVDRRAIMTADLSDVPLSPAAGSDLATDAVAALESRRELHTFAFAIHRRLGEVLADRGPLVPPGARPQAVSMDAAHSVLELQEALRDAHAEQAVVVEPGESARGGHLTVAEALSSGALTLIAGSRLPAEPLERGTLRLITSSVVLGDSPALRVDPLAPAVAGCRRTEPGDVVFITSPRPCALVDRDGLSVVAYPARILRPAPGSGLVSEAVATAISAQADASRDWRGWSLPQVSPVHADNVAAALAYLADEEATLRQRAAALAQARVHMAGVVAMGAAVVSLTGAESHVKYDVQHSSERKVS